jgi:hypothetical protein
VVVRVHESGDVVSHMTVRRRDATLEGVAREDDFPGTAGPSRMPLGGIATDQT